MEGDDSATAIPCDDAHFNPLPPYGGRLCNVSVSDLGGVISIHSLRMEGDLAIVRHDRANQISIHSLRMEGDLLQ